MEVWSLEHFWALADGAKLNFIVALIFANFATGVGSSLLQGKFSLTKVGDIFAKRLIPSLLAYASVIAVAMAEDDWSVFVPIVTAMIITWLSALAWSNIKEVFPGLPDIPVISKLIKKDEVTK
jgi:hypothetical protein